MNFQKLSFSKKTLFLALFCVTSSLSPMGKQLANNNQLTSQIAMGEFCLLNAALNNNKRELTAWIACGVDINAARDGFTSLHLAARFNYVEIGKILLDNNKILKNPQDNDGNTPLHHAVQKKHIKFIELLLQYGADQTIKNNHEENPMSVLLRNLDQANSNADDTINTLKRRKPQAPFVEELLEHIDSQIKKKRKLFSKIHTELLIARLNETK